MKKQFLLYGSFLCLGLVFGELEGMGTNMYTLIAHVNMDIDKFKILTDATNHTWITDINTWSSRFANCLKKHPGIGLNERGFTGAFEAWSQFNRNAGSVDDARRKVHDILNPSPGPKVKKKIDNDRMKDSKAYEPGGYACWEADTWSNFPPYSIPYVPIVSGPPSYGPSALGYAPWCPTNAQYPANSCPPPYCGSPAYGSQMVSGPGHSCPPSGYGPGPSGPFNDSAGSNQGNYYPPNNSHYGSSIPQYGPPRGFGSGPSSPPTHSGPAFSGPPQGPFSGASNQLQGPAGAFVPGPYNQQMSSGPGFSGPPAGPSACSQPYPGNPAVGFGSGPNIRSNHPAGSNQGGYVNLNCSNQGPSFPMTGPGGSFGSGPYSPPAGLNHGCLRQPMGFDPPFVPAMRYPGDFRQGARDVPSGSFPSGGQNQGSSCPPERPNQGSSFQQSGQPSAPPATTAPAAADSIATLSHDVASRSIANDAELIVRIIAAVDAVGAVDRSPDWAVYVSQLVDNVIKPFGRDRSLPTRPEDLLCSTIIGRLENHYRSTPLQLAFNRAWLSLMSGH